MLTAGILLSLIILIALVRPNLASITTFALKARHEKPHLAQKTPQKAVNSTDSDEKEDIWDKLEREEGERKAKEHEEWTEQFLALMPIEDRPDYIKMELGDEIVDSETISSLTGPLHEFRTYQKEDGRQYKVTINLKTNKAGLSHGEFFQDITEDFYKIEESRLERNYLQVGPVWEESKRPLTSNTETPKKKKKNTKQITGGWIQVPNLDPPKAPLPVMPYEQDEYKNAAIKNFKDRVKLGGDYNLDNLHNMTDEQITVVHDILLEDFHKLEKMKLDATVLNQMTRLADVAYMLQAEQQRRKYYNV